MRFGLVAVACALMASQAGAVVTYDDTSYVNKGQDQIYWLYPEGVDNFAPGLNTFRLDVFDSQITSGVFSLSWFDHETKQGGTDFCSSATGCGAPSFVTDVQWGSDYLQFSATKPSGSWDFGEIAFLQVSGPSKYRVSFTPGVSSAVPEPATWALMIGGFGLVGAAMRRSRPVAALAA